MKPILTPHASISHFMTYGGPEFIKMIPKNNKMTYFFFFLLVFGGIKMNLPGQLVPRGEDNQGGGKINQDSLLSGGKSIAVSLALGASCPGVKINWDTGISCYEF